MHWLPYIAAILFLVWVIRSPIDSWTRLAGVAVLLLVGLSALGHYLVLPEQLEVDTGQPPFGESGSHEARQIISGVRGHIQSHFPVALFALFGLAILALYPGRRSVPPKPVEPAGISPDHDAFNT